MYYSEPFIWHLIFVLVYCLCRHFRARGLLPHRRLAKTLGRVGADDTTASRPWACQAALIRTHTTLQDEQRASGSWKEQTMWHTTRANKCWFRWAQTDDRACREYLGRTNHWSVERVARRRAASAAWVLEKSRSRAVLWRTARSKVSRTIGWGEGLCLAFRWWRRQGTELAALRWRWNIGKIREGERLAHRLGRMLVMWWLSSVCGRAWMTPVWSGWRWWGRLLLLLLFLALPQPFHGTWESRIMKGWRYGDEQRRSPM